MQQHILAHTRPARVSQIESARLLKDIATLGPTLAARAPEIEAAQRIPLDIVETLKLIGVFRMFAPKSLGGFELSIPEGAEVLEALARIDGSIAWCSMIGSFGKTMLQKLPPESYALVNREGADPIVAGSGQAFGRAERVAGGWRVSGRWSFASGCQHADWIAGFCQVMENGQPVLETNPASPGGTPGPMVRAAILPAAEWRIEDTWHVAGLKGTGSHHVALEDKLVPDAFFVDVFNGPSRSPGPLYGNVMEFMPLLNAPVSVGIAQAALDDVARLALTGRQQVRAPTAMQESEVFQFELGRAAAEVAGARAMVRSRIQEYWDRAGVGALGGEADRITAIQTAVWVMEAAIRAVDICFNLAGGAAVYENAPIQRRFRDIHILAEHALTHRRHYTAGGKLYLKNAEES